MRRVFVAMMVLGLIAGSLATAEGKKKEKGTRVQRTVEGSYEGPFVAQVTGCNLADRQFGCLSIVTKGRERFFTAKVSDAHGLPVQVDVLAHRQGYHPNSFEELASFCGETTKPVSFPRRSELTFRVGLGWVDDYVHPDCPSYPSSGTISVTLSNVP